MKTGLMVILVAFFWAQQPALWEFNSPATEFAVDDLDNIYLRQKDKIQKLQFSGEIQYTYSDLRMIGNYQLDVTRSLRPVIFYPEIGRLVVLDNTLSAQAEQIDLYNLPYGRITVLGVSRMAPHYWLFDQSTFELIRVDQSLKEVLRSGNLATLLGKDVNPVKIVESNEKVFLFEENQDILVFDVYGTYYYTLHMKGLDDCHVNKNVVYGHNDTELRVYNLQTKSWKNYPLPVKDPRFVRITGDRLYLIHSGKLQSFPLKME